VKTIIAGSRELSDPNTLYAALERITWEISEVVCGEARGVDAVGKSWAVANGIPVKSFPADWRLYGKSAGMIRNRQMASYADALLAIWDGRSPGTANMINLAKENDLKLFVYITEKTELRKPNASK
jgi:hypothetical protein